MTLKRMITTPRVENGVGRRIFSWRMEHDISLLEMHEQTGLSYSLLWEMETGKRKPVKIATIETLAEYMHVKPGWLLWGE